MNITRHAQLRINQRMPRRPTALDRLIDDVIRYGVGLEDASGRVRDYIRTRTTGPNVRVVLYNGYTFVFKNQALVTVYRIRGAARRLAGRQQRRKREAMRRGS